MRLKSIKINDTGDRQYVGLAEVDGVRNLTIVIGYGEIQAIDRFVKEQKPPRPLTHDLVVGILEETGTSVERIDITELRGGTFFAVLKLRTLDGRQVEVDARPSDAIAVASALGARIFVAEDVLNEAMSVE